MNEDVELVGLVVYNVETARAAVKEFGLSVALVTSVSEVAAATGYTVVSVLRSGAVPSAEVHSNVLSLAVVEEAVKPASTGQRVLIDDVVEDAYRVAVADEWRANVRAALESWNSARVRGGRCSCAPARKIVSVSP